MFELMKQVDELGNTRTLFVEYDDEMKREGGKLHVVDSFDVTPILKKAEDMRYLNDIRKANGEFRGDKVPHGMQIYELPIPLVEQWERRYGIVWSSPEQSGMSRERHKKFTRELVEREAPQFKWVSWKLA